MSAGREAPGLRVRTVRHPTASELTQLRWLLDTAFGDRFDDNDFAHALGGTHVLVVRGTTLVSHAAVVPRALHLPGGPLHCGYVEAVATDPAHQRQGAATLAMGVVAEIVRGQYDLGALSTGVHRFYRRLGWQVWTGPTHVVRNGEWHRTPTEDGSVMVLLTATGTPVDVSSPVAVDDRPGDAW